MLWNITTFRNKSVLCFKAADKRHSNRFLLVTVTQCDHDFHCHGCYIKRKSMISGALPSQVATSLNNCNNVKLLPLAEVTEISTNNYWWVGPSIAVKAVRYKSVGPGIDSKRRHLQFILWQLTFPCEYQDIPGGKGGRCLRVTTFMYPVSSNLEP